MKTETAFIIAPDNPESSRLLEVFRDLGYEAHRCLDKESFINWVHQQPCALCVYDSALSVSNSQGDFALFRDNLDTHNVPLIYLTHVDTPAQLWKDVGAELYVQSTTSPDKIKTQIASFLEYFQNQPHKSAPSASRGLFQVDEQRRWLWYGDRAIPMTPTELKIMSRLLSHPRHVFTRQELASTIWAEDDPSKYRRIDVNLRRIRKRCEVLGIKLPITTVRGHGYSYRP
ncbi:MAG: phosphate regulon transcriptional regulator PhoB [Pseudomonadota bacterium]|jgi:DNA-binding response OmpR family regulator